jgi:large subunit ribosomal protein L4
MPSVALYNMNGDNVGTMDLNEEIFAADINQAVLHEVVVNYLANQRQGTQNTKTRAEVSGGGKKPWRQKGTGRARQGSIRSPQWKGGGVALGPKPRDFGYQVNKKVKRAAMKSALSSKVTDEKFIVVDEITFPEIKTKNVVSMLRNLNADGKLLLVLANNDNTAYMSAKNIAGLNTTYADVLNVYDVLNCDKVVIAKGAVEKIEEVLAK